MSSGILNVPWADRWRWVVSTLLFFLLISVPADVFLSFDDGPFEVVVQFVVLAVAAVLAAVVVRSDAVPWPGD